MQHDLTRLQPVIAKIDRLFAERENAGALRQNDITREINETLESGVCYLVHFRHFTRFEAVTTMRSAFPQLCGRFSA